MDCNTARSLLPYLALPDELAGEDKAQFDRHLASCPGCAAALAAQRTFDDRVGRAINNVTIPAGLREQITTRLAVERGHVWRRQLIQATTAAAALLLVTLGLAWWASQKVDISADALARQTDDTLMVVVVDPAGVERHFRDQGLQVRLVPDFDANLLV